MNQNSTQSKPKWLARLFLCGSIVGIWLWWVHGGSPVGSAIDPWFITETPEGEHLLITSADHVTIYERANHYTSFGRREHWRIVSQHKVLPPTAPTPLPRYIVVDHPVPEERDPRPLPIWINQNFTVIEPWPGPFHTYARLNRSAASALPIRPAESTKPGLDISPEVSPGQTLYRLGSDYGPAHLTGLGLRHGNDQVEWLEFARLNHCLIQQRISADIATEPILTLQPLVRYGVGAWDAGDVVTVWTRPLAAPNPQEVIDFALPLGSESVPPTEFAMRFGARREWQDNRPLFAVHAPGWLGYELPPAVTRLRGYYGLPPGASAADNPSPSDGATFVISLRGDKGYHTELHHHTLRPSTDPSEHAIDLALPASDGSRTLVLRIDTGPRGDASSDWTYWRDLRLFAE